jgi:ABC-type polysaccharide/polyol phosphate export permease
MNYKTLNNVRKAIVFLPDICGRIILFTFSPILLVLFFLLTNWEKSWDRWYFREIMKSAVSFGLWKEPPFDFLKKELQ